MVAIGVLLIVAIVSYQVFPMIDAMQEPKRTELGKLYFFFILFIIFATVVIHISPS